MLKLPPRIKVLEALGAIADGRVKIVEKNEKVVATCKSSNYDKEYKIIIKGNKVYSNDNGTYYRRYVGYPIISVLMLIDKLPYNKKIGDKLKGIKWKNLNERLKNYWKVEYVIKKRYLKEMIDEVDEYIKEIMNKLKELKLEFNEKLS